MITENRKKGPLEEIIEWTTESRELPSQRAQVLVAED
jgi:hypothetical protein